MHWSKHLTLRSAVCLFFQTLVQALNTQVGSGAMCLFFHALVQALNTQVGSGRLCSSSFMHWSKHLTLRSAVCLFFHALVQALNTQVGCVPLLHALVQALNTQVGCVPLLHALVQALNTQVGCVPLLSCIGPSTSPTGLNLQNFENYTDTTASLPFCVYLISKSSTWFRFSPSASGDKIFKFLKFQLGLENPRLWVLQGK